MKFELKNFNVYTIICTVFMYLSGFGMVLGGLSALGFGLIGGITAGSNSTFGPIAGLFILVAALVYALLYIILGGFMIILANKYVARMNRSRELLDDSLNSQEQLTILKDLERREFWIERLSIYPMVYISAIFMICSIVLLPAGVVLLMLVQSQRRMDIIKNNVNFNALEADTNTKVIQSNLILDEVKSKIKWEAISYIVMFVTGAVFFAGLIAVIIAVPKSTTGPYQTLPKNNKRNNPFIIED
jgi:MFS family permease